MVSRGLFAISTIAVLAGLMGCGDNLPLAPPCTAVDHRSGRALPLRTASRVLPSRDILLAGSFTDQLDLGGAPIARPGDHAFVAVLGAAGPRSLQTFAGGDPQLAELAIDNAGNFAIAGRFRDHLELGGTSLVVAGSGMFVAAFAADGALRFGKAYAGEFFVRGLAISAAGDVAIAGTHFDPIDFGGGPIATSTQFLGILDRGGDHVASRGLAVEDLSTGLDVALAFDGDELVLAGSFTESIDLGGGVLTSAGGTDLYVARLDRTARHRASRRIGGSGDDGYSGFDGDRIALALAADHGLVLSTGFTGTIDVGDGPVTTPDELDDVLVVRLDRTLATVWGQTLSNPSYQATGALAIATDGTIGLTGVSGSETLPDRPLACGDPDALHAYAATFDRAGNLRWSACFASPQFGFGRWLGFTAPDELVIGGSFVEALSFGDGTITGDPTMTVGFLETLRPSCR